MLNILELRALAEDGNLSVIAGAGISAPEPSCLPLARPLVDLAAEAISADLDDELRAAARDAALTLRPEVFAKSLIDFCGWRSASFLRLFGHAEPNENHHRLVQCLASGGIVATTNFDTLIEDAAAIAGVPIGVGIPPTYRLVSAVGRVFKLHGTIARDKPHSFKNLSISFRQTALRRTRYLRSALKRIFAAPVVVIVGYSGLDDFDINPILRTLDRRMIRTVWIDHVPGKAIPAEDENLEIHLTPSTVRGAASLFPHGAYIRCDTKEFLRCLFPHAAVPKANRKPHESSRRRVLTEWVHDLPVPASAILGDIALTANQPVLATSLLNRSLVGERLTKARRVRIMLRQAIALRRQGQPILALTVAERASVIAKAGGSLILQSEADQALGSYRRLTSDWRGAAKAYLSGAKLLRRRRNAKLQQAELMNSLAIALDKLGKTRMAVEILRAPLRWSAQLGELELQARLHNNFGYMHHNLGANLQAIYHLETSLSLKQELGDTFGLGNGFQNLGWVHQQNGQWLPARKAFSESLRIKKQAGADRHGVAQSQSSLAQVFVELAKNRRARKYLQRAIPALREAGDVFGSAEAAWAMARALLSMGNCSGSERWAKVAQVWLDPLPRTPEVRRLAAAIRNLQH